MNFHRRISFNVLHVLKPLLSDEFSTLERKKFRLEVGLVSMKDEAPANNVFRQKKNKTKKKTKKPNKQTHKKRTTLKKMYRIWLHTSFV